jgi:excisionase family DNA binding protein
MSEFLTLEEVAINVKVKPRTVLDWVQTGKLKGLKIGKQWRIPAENLEAFIYQAAGESPQQPESLEPDEPEPKAVDCLETLVALIRALLPEGQQVYLRDRGLTELPLGALNTLLGALGLTIHAAKVRDVKRSVACADVAGHVEPYGLFELRQIHQETTGRKNEKRRRGA